MGTAVPKKRNQYEYDKKAYDHLHLQIRKGKRNELKEAAVAKGYDSLNGYIKALLEKDTGLEL